jgi:hypothetical protein
LSLFVGEDYRVAPRGHPLARAALGASGCTVDEQEKESQDQNLPPPVRLARQGGLANTLVSPGGFAKPQQCGKKSE